MKVLSLPARWALYGTELKRGPGRGLVYAAAGWLSIFPEGSREQPLSTGTSKEVTSGYALDTPPCCRHILLSLFAKEC